MKRMRYGKKHNPQIKHRQSASRWHGILAFFLCIFLLVPATPRSTAASHNKEKEGQLESGMSWEDGMKTLDLLNNPLLTELDLTNNPKFQKLYCDGNKISTVNLSSNALLKELYCDHNKLKALDLSGKERMIKCPYRILITLVRAFVIREKFVGRDEKKLL
jgi:hypothetical protein